MGKEQRKYCGLTFVLDNESYSKYKGTLNKQIEELQERIDKAIIELQKPKTTNNAIKIVYDKQVENALKILKGEE